MLGRCLPLVPEDVWTHDEHQARLCPLLAHHCVPATACSSPCTLWASQGPLGRYYEYSNFEFLNAAVQDLQPCDLCHSPLWEPLLSCSSCSTSSTAFSAVKRPQRTLGRRTPWNGPPQWKHVHGNWPGALPEVHRWAYDYSQPSAFEEDFVPQTTPPLVMVK